MNILVTLNSGYIDVLCVMLKSLLISNPDTTFDVYVNLESRTAFDGTNRKCWSSGFFMTYVF